MSSPIRVLIADDSALMRSMLARRISSDSRFEIIASACNGQEAIEKTIQFKPDIVTLDVEMPVLNGLDALKQIVAQTRTPVIMISSLTEAGARVTLDALSLGAVDFVPKANGAEHIHEKLLAAFQTSQIARRNKAPKPKTNVTDAKPQTVALQRRTAYFRPRAVVIGSSTGGPQALEFLLNRLPSSANTPIFIAQHMPKLFTSVLAERLNSLCPLHVVEAKQGDMVRKGVVYIAQGSLHMTVSENTIHVHPNQGESLYCPSVDVLAASVSKNFNGEVLGVMLTGLGNDGTKEFLRMREAGGYTIAQDQESCTVFGMPKSLIEAGGADETLSLSDISPKIASLIG